MIVPYLFLTALALILSATGALNLHSGTDVRRGRNAQLRRDGSELLPSRLTSSATMLTPATSFESEDGMLSRDVELSRRSWLARSSTLVGGLSLVGTLSVKPAGAAPDRVPLEELLYRILRVREATQQETRLIKTGKFKDVQRANVKLAVKFMIENYRLADAFIQASTYLEGGPTRRVEAGQVGQGAVQSLYTILEYFDASDVQNIKVGSSDSMSGKEELVLKGLDSARDSIDAFLRYFPKPTVDAVNARVREENELNIKEFDPALGSIINLPPTP